jgi:ketosteroid isomerase-like protein
MTCTPRLLASIVPCALAVGCAGSMPTNGAGDVQWQAFLPRFELATERFINGDNTLWRELASQADDASVMGAWGAFETGWAQAGPRYDWAAARFLPSSAKLQVQYLSVNVSGSLASTVSIERSTALVVGVPQAAPLQLRVTHLFRKEQGAWKLLHRHADPLLAKTSPADTFQR